MVYELLLLVPNRLSHQKSIILPMWWRGRYLIKIIDIIGRAGLLCIFFLTVVGLTLSYLNNGNSGFGRSFGAPEIMVITIIAIPSIGLIVWPAGWNIGAKK